MSKKIQWPEGKFTSAAKKPGHYSSFNEWFEKAETQRKEQENARDLLQKAYPVMAKLLEIRLRDREPLVVRRPLTYTTSVLNTQLNKADPLEASFYHNEEEVEAASAKFVDIQKTVYPGVQLFIKNLDMAMEEFIFVDSSDNEHAIPFANKQQLMTQTDIWERASGLLESEDS